nr:putative laccase [Tanacetum cinerariifolium]
MLYAGEWWHADVEEVVKQGNALVRPFQDVSIPVDNKTSTAIFQYTNIPTTVIPTLPHLPLPNDTAFALSYNNKLRSLSTPNYPANVPLKVDRHLLFTVGLGKSVCPTCINGTRLSASLNNITFVMPKTGLLQAHYFNMKGVFNTDFSDKPPKAFNYTGAPLTANLFTTKGTRLSKIAFNSTVELVIQDTNLLSVESHPFHLHGFNFFVVGTGIGNFDPAKDAAKYNLVDPPETNTVGVPTGGWAAIRFGADNPEELERFKLRSGKARLADDKTLDIATVREVVFKTSFGTSWTLKDVRYIRGLKRRLISVGQLDEEGYHRLGDMSSIGMNMLAFKGNVPDVRKVDIYFCKPGGLGKQKKLSFIMSEKTRKLQRSCGRYDANLQFGVAERLSRTLRAKSTGIRVEAPKMLWEYSVSTAYLIYRIPVSIGLRTTEEEWRGKDTSLTHLKLSRYEESPGYPKQRYHIYGLDLWSQVCDKSSSLTKPIQKSQVVLVDIPKNLAENDNIVAEHGLSSKITQSLGGSLDTSEGSKNRGSFEDSRKSDKEDSEYGAFSKEGGSETPQVRRSTRESRALVRYSQSANYLLLTENGELESYSEALSSKESVQ